jgi:hypothetical protein
VPRFLGIEAKKPEVTASDREQSVEFRAPSPGRGRRKPHRFDGFGVPVPRFIGIEAQKNRSARIRPLGRRGISGALARAGASRFPSLQWIRATSVALTAA